MLQPRFNCISVIKEEDLQRAVEKVVTDNPQGVMNYILALLSLRGQWYQEPMIMTVGASVYYNVFHVNNLIRVAMKDDMKDGSPDLDDAQKLELVAAVEKRIKIIHNSASGLQ